jgi:tRNA pseudouridine55 synthase
MEGFLLIDKPAGITSHDVVNRVRRITGEKRVGHAGTLDPFATGLLIVGVGRAATREMEKLVGLDKTYEAVFVLGARSDTDDRTGKIEEAPIGNLPLPEGGIQKVLKQFVGEIEQVPPTYSAIKIGGKKMYEEARKGRPMEATPRHVTIYSIEILNTQQLNDSTTQRLHLRIHCSSGTYIRAIARDLGEALGGGGYVETLRRTSIGPFLVDDAISVTTQAKAWGNTTSTSFLIPISQFLARL